MARDDEAVFPDYHAEYVGEGATHWLSHLRAEGGVQLRDLFAAAAMAGLLASGRSENLAAQSYALADVMLSERGRGA